MTGLSGVLPLDKPPGPTSHDVVEQLRRSTGVRRVGHAGTLDPFASGLLLLLLGSSTRLAEYFVHENKRYVASARLGAATTTDDIEGDILQTWSGWEGLTVGVIEATLARFRGKITQVPPTYSAKKVRGEPAHRRVRRGESVTLQPVSVEIHEIVLEAVDLPQITFSVVCSAGTYIRALARDLGAALGGAGHLVALRRTEIGSFSVGDALSWEELRDPDRVLDAVLDPARAVSHLPSHDVTPEEANRIGMGQALVLTELELPENTPVAILSGGELLAVGRREGSLLKPRKVLAHG